jgi:hypothetical protein
MLLKAFSKKQALYPCNCPPSLYRESMSIFKDSFGVTFNNKPRANWLGNVGSSAERQDESKAATCRFSKLQQQREMQK